MKERRYVHPRTGLGFLIATVVACVTVVLSGSSTRATTVEDLTAGLTPGVPTIAMPEGDGIGVWNEVDNATGVVVNGAVCSGAVCGRQGEWRQWPADRLLNGRLWPNGYPEGSTYIWNPIGAASWGTYYTNGLYVAGNGQYVLPGETIVRTFGSDATPPPTVPTTTTQAPSVTAPGGITGVEAYVINSSGVRCHLTGQGYWDHSRSCVDTSRIQFALCFQGTGQLSVSGASLGMTVSDNGVVVGSVSYPPPGVTLVSAPSCQRGYLTAWAFDGAEQGRSYQIEVWGRAGGVDLASSWTLTTPTPPPPSVTTAPGAPTTSATTTTTTAPDTTTIPSTSNPTTSNPASTTTTAPTTGDDRSAGNDPGVTVSALNDAAPATASPPSAGEALVDGQSVPLTITVTDEAVTARSAGVTVEVAPSTESGAATSTPVAASGTIEVTPAQAVEVTTSGFLPGSEVEIWLHSEPMLLARARADASGTLRASVKIPDITPDGQHRLVITGRSPTGAPVSVAMAVRVVGGDTAPESNVGTIAVSVATMLVLAALVVVVRRRLRWSFTRPAAAPCDVG